MIPLFTTGDKGKVASGVAGIYPRSSLTKHPHVSHSYNNYIINTTRTFQPRTIATDPRSVRQVINISFTQSRSITHAWKQMTEKIDADLGALPPFQ